MSSNYFEEILEKKEQQKHNVISLSNPFREQYFFGHGKLLLTGEYLVLDGAKAIGLPTKLGQSLKVSYKNSYSPMLRWKSKNYKGDCWFEASFELWHFNLIEGESTKETEWLQKVLLQARKQNPHFLRDSLEIDVETTLEFPIDWGLGSSSSLIYNIAQWAYISPFELMFKTFQGSGYDVACAQSLGPIMYQKKEVGPEWKEVNFLPTFKNSLYFVYRGQKADTQIAVKNYLASGAKNDRSKMVKEISEISEAVVKTNELKIFNELIREHEKIMSLQLGQRRVKDELFSDFWGEIKSLGAWGGDFILVTSEKEMSFVKDYFANKGFPLVVPYDGLICQSSLLLH